jgi:hypothetical protein
MTEDFCVFILSHGRPENVPTVKTLKRGGYTGRWYIVLDTDDPTATQYRQTFGSERILTFDKPAIARTFDTADLSRDYRTVVFARNACFDLAKQVGVSRFLELDDDYVGVSYRFQEGDKLRGKPAKDLDALFTAMLDFLNVSGAASVALGQTGELVGGASKTGRWAQRLARKAMNTFFLRTDADWRFMGRLNEDVNVYSTLAHRGHLFFTTLYAVINQTPTQAQSGGMTDVYLDNGTYVKSFYSVMMCPSACSIFLLPSTHMRIHHHVETGNCMPKILDETYRKPTG